MGDINLKSKRPRHVYLIHIKAIITANIDLASIFMVMKPFHIEDTAINIAKF